VTGAREKKNSNQSNKKSLQSMAAWMKDESTTCPYVSPVSALMLRIMHHLVSHTGNTV
jgi:hypothetical protein